MTAGLHTLTAAYAVHALSADEEALFERHLEECEACRQEVRELRETTAVLAAGVAQPPSRALGIRVLAQVATTRRLPPPVPPALPAPTPVPQPPRQRRGWVGPALLGAAAALLVLVVALGAVTVRLDDELDSSRSTLAGVTQVLSSADTGEVFGSPGSGNVRLVVSRSAGRAVLFSSNVTPAPNAEDYQLWFMSAGSITSAGLLPARGSGSTDPMLLTLPADARDFGITLEPAGGSGQPSTEPLLKVPIPTA